MVHQLREDARLIYSAGIKAVDPAQAVKKALSVDSHSLFCQEMTLPLPAGSIKLIGAGKAAAPMAAAVEELLGARLSEGLVVTKDGHGGPLQRTELLEAAHPVPDTRGQRAATRILDFADRCGQDDLVIALISGGGSALLPAPVDPVQLADKMAITDLLLRSGASIDEINTVRKHLSAIKGGRLAQRVHPAQLLTLVISDVIGDDLEVIASGPTVPDSSTYTDALKVLEKYRLTLQAPASVVDLLNRGSRGDLAETPKPGQLSNSDQTRIIASNAHALEAARVEAEKLGYECLFLGSDTSGEASQVAKELVSKARNANGIGPLCLLAGGETTVTIKGDGRGGRNQELALSAAIDLEGVDDVVALAGGTDGNDGPTDAAGAVVDGQSLVRGRARGLSATASLADNDSYTFHQATGDLLVTGPTQTNVMDIYLVLTAPR